MRGHAAQRMLLASCFIVFALVLIYNLAGPRAQSIDDINLVPGDNIDVEDLLELLTIQTPAFPIENLLFLLSSSWRQTIVVDPTPTATEFVIPTPGATPTMSGENTFNLQDYFITSQGSTWHYAGFNGGSVEDNYSYTVEDTLQDVGIGQMASRFLTETDEPTDDRNGNVDFFLLEDGTKGTGGSSGDLFFFGFFLTKGFSGINTIIATDPVRLGGDGLRIGDEVVDTGAASVSLGSVSMTSSIRFTDFLPTFETPLGTFTHVLRMEGDVTGLVDTPLFDIPFEVFDTTFFLKEGVGVIAIDQSPDPNDAELLGIDSGTVYVGGNPVTVTAN